VRVEGFQRRGRCRSAADEVVRAPNFGSVGVVFIVWALSKKDYLDAEEVTRLVSFRRAIGPCLEFYHAAWRQRCGLAASTTKLPVAGLKRLQERGPARSWTAVQCVVKQAFKGGCTLRFFGRLTGPLLIISIEKLLEIRTH
jgi:hypothetical protein